MSAEEQLLGNSETIDLQQQVARLQALLEASRQVHSTIQEKEVLEQVLRISVRELEMAGAAFTGTGLCYGEDPAEAKGVTLPSWPLEDRSGAKMAELVVLPPDGRALTIYEADFIEGLVLQAAVALENARNHKRNVDGFSVSYRSDTCYEVGGDYLDIVEQPDGNLLIAVADVAGKGLASAIVSVSFRSAFRGMAVSGLSLAELATQMNQHHWAEGEEARRRYVTAIFLKLNPKTAEMEIVNAGHNPGFLLAPGAEPREFNAAGTPLGLLPGMSYIAEHAIFEPGARLLFYTDGLTEVFCGDEEFGSERLLNEFSTCKSAKADDILDALWVALTEFAAGGEQGDDMTALALCRGTEMA
jgi:hypothetical protein